MRDFKKKLKTGIRKLGGAGAFTGILLCILLFLSQGVVRLVKEDAGLLLEGNKSIAGISSASSGSTVIRRERSSIWR